MGKKEDESLNEISEVKNQFLEKEHVDEDDTSTFNYHVRQGRISELFGPISSFLKFCWNKTAGKLDGDWVFLTLLGVFMACISLFVEATIKYCTMSRIYLFKDLITIPILKYFGWIVIPCCLMLFSTAFTSLFAPQVAGSGIPELKTTMGGIILKESFTFKALVTKIIGLTATLGTGLPIGREGPFVHIASMLAVVITKFTSNIKGEYVNRSRNIDVMAAGCAVGVASAFAAPVGGVLFSIEVTSFYFAVRNYYRGFYAAVCGTVMHRLLAVWYKGDASLIAVYKTNITSETPYALQELFGFIVLGIICGLLGALFVWTHRQYITFKNNNRIMKSISNRSVVLYPVLVTLIYTTISFPLGAGMFMAGELTIDQQVSDAFANFSWQKPNPTVNEFAIISHWRSPYTGIYVNLVTYLVFGFFGSIAAISLPVPAGVFIPVFKFGAVLGRLFGELMVSIFPEGFSEGMIDTMIIPGAYAIVGAASFAGAATHTVSTAVIAFELTGQISFAIPIMVGVLISNAIAQVLQPSIFDSIIRMKKLPYLPAIPSTSVRAYDIFVENFMDREIIFIWYGITYNQLKLILLQNKKLTDFPLVDSAESMVLLGSANRYDLIELIQENVNEKRKQRYFNEWKLRAEKILGNELHSQSDEVLERKQTDSTRLRKNNLLSLPQHDNIAILDEIYRNQSSQFGTEIGQSGVINEKTDGEASEQPTLPFGKPVSENAVDKSTDNTLASRFDKFNTKYQTAPQTSITGKALSGSLDTLQSLPQPLTIPTIDIEYIDSASLDGDSSGSPKISHERKLSRFSVTRVEGPSDSSPLSERKNVTSDGKERNTDKEANEIKKLLQKTAASLHPTSALSAPSASNAQEEPEENEDEPLKPILKKSILKKTQSFVFEPNKQEFGSPYSKRNYMTIHGDGAHFKGMKQSLTAFLKTKSLLGMDGKSSSITFTGISRADIPTTRLIKLIKGMEIEWEEERMKKKVDFSKCQINPAPHQLVERTNLLQVHSMFSLLGLNHSYVTAIGRLIGIVTLNELRVVIEKMNAGELINAKSESESENPPPPPISKNNRRFSFGFFSSR